MKYWKAGIVYGSLALVLAFTIMGGFSQIALADSAKKSVCDGVNMVGDGGGGDPNCNGGNSAQGVSHILAVAINLLSLIAGVAAVIMIIIGGLRMITANGDSGSIATARTIIIYSIVGLIVVALAQVIVRFILGKI